LGKIAKHLGQGVSGKWPLIRHAEKY
jgi:hypothetical protein